MLGLIAYQVFLYLAWVWSIFYILFKLPYKPSENLLLHSSTGFFVGSFVSFVSLAILLKVKGTIAPSQDVFRTFDGLIQIATAGFFNALLVYKSTKLWLISYYFFVGSRIMMTIVFLAILQGNFNYSDGDVWGGMALGVFLSFLWSGSVSYLFTKYVKHFPYNLFGLNAFFLTVNGIQNFNIKNVLTAVIWDVPDCCRVDNGSPFMFMQHLFGLPGRTTVGDLVVYAFILQFSIGVTVLMNKRITKKIKKVNTVTGEVNEVEEVVEQNDVIEMIVDENGNQVTTDELATIEAARDIREGAEMKAFDLDGDGVVSREEAEYAAASNEAPVIIVQTPMQQYMPPNYGTMPNTAPVVSSTPVVTETVTRSEGIFSKIINSIGNTIEGVTGIDVPDVGVTTTTVTTTPTPAPAPMPAPIPMQMQMQMQMPVPMQVAVPGNQFRTGKKILRKQLVPTGAGEI